MVQIGTDVMNNTRETPQALRTSRHRVSSTDSRRFIWRLLVAAILATLGIVMVQSRGLLTILGVLLLGAIYAHAVELQHQCLHQTAFVRRWPHRLVGVLLGLPMLVSYSHYRVKHLQHHRFLGTARDSEFFGFDPRRELTAGQLFEGLFDFRRLALVARDIAKSASGSWQYTHGQISPRERRRVVNEYRLMGLLLVVAIVLASTGFATEVFLLWLAPLAVAVPIHFLVELPEHVMCDSDTEDVLRNTRSITGSWLTSWFTNSNNFHVEHHLSMDLPLQRLRDMHDSTAAHAKHIEPNYLSFGRRLWHEIRKGR